MSQAAHAQQLAPVIDIFEHVSPEERALILARRGQHNPRPHGWDDLRFVTLTDKRDDIRIYHRLGLHPLVLHGVRPDGPCTCWRGSNCPPRHRGKHPVAENWQADEFSLDAADALLIDEPLRNIGVRTGRQRDGRFLIVVDVDGERELLRPLEAEHGTFPETLTARTGSGGLHLYYWSNVEMGNRVGVVPHVDLRARGGQVVVPPSRHYSGSSYNWTNIRPPAVLP